MEEGINAIFVEMQQLPVGLVEEIKYMYN